MSKAAPIGKSFFRDAAEAAPSPLRTVEPAQPKATPSAKPAARQKPKQEPANDEPKITLGFKVTPSFKWELKAYATKLRKSQHQVVMEALDLHRAKYDKG